jgi:hypothetical protein
MLHATCFVKVEPFLTQARMFSAMVVKNILAGGI